MHPIPTRNGHARNGDLHPSAPRFTLPSSNGDNGVPANAAPPSPNGDNGRDSRGRFAKGNRGGPGNPFARRVARLRTLLLDLVSDDDLRAVLQKLVERARSGDVAAARLVLAYLIGRPVDTVDPDRLDVEEWRQCQELPTWEDVLVEQRDKLDPAAACALAQKLRNKGWEEARSTLAERQQELASRTRENPPSKPPESLPEPVAQDKMVLGEQGPDSVRTTAMYTTPPQEQLARTVTPELYQQIRRLWIKHSLAEDARDLDGLIATLTDDCVYEVVPTGQRWEGHEGARAFYTAFLGAFPDVKFNLTDIVIGPQGVIEVAEMTGTQQGPWAGQAPTGRAVRLLIVIHFPWDPAKQKFAGEKVYFDRMALQGERPA